MFFGVSLCLRKFPARTDKVLDLVYPVESAGKVLKIHSRLQFTPIFFRIFG